MLVVVGVLFLFIAVAPNASPQEVTGSNPLNLAAAIQIAESKYPAIRAAEEQREAARSAVGLAKTAYLPRVDLIWQGNRSTTNKPNIVSNPQTIVPVPSTSALPTTGQSDWNSLTGVQLSWQPFDFGMRRAQVSVAQAGFEVSKHVAELSRLDVETAAAAAYFDLAAASQYVRVQEVNVKRMESFAKAVHVLADSTLRPGADASQADAQLAIARTELIQAQTQVKVRLEALANFLQIPAQEITIDDHSILSAAPAKSLTDESVERHPAVLQQLAIVNQQKEQVSLLNHSWAPVFTFSGSVSGLGSGLSSASPGPVFRGGTAGLAPDTYNWMTALQVTFPAFQIFAIRQQKKVQEAQVNSAVATRQVIESNLSAQAKEARVILDGARLIAQNTPIELSAAQVSEQQQQARYKAGLATVIEVSTAEAALAKAESDDALARLSVWRAILGVAVAQGDLGPFLQILSTQK
jgi:outer membrane protein